ncbi:MAG TPA: PilN domain-containing protein [Candidatus Saccharimonadales bacterium]|nr:PilN domain-containing protein [Candidatus Saccharimonadales bacterium]
MIQFNLLPDVKLQYLKAERLRRVVISLSVLVTVASLALLLLLLSITGLQKKHLADLTSDIKKDSSTLEKQPDLNKILTVQNQLSSLTGLHNSKPAVSRLFGYLSQVVPTQVNANNLTIDFAQHTLTITGTTDSLSSVNKFVDTLKFTTYSVKGVDGSKPAFSNVVLTSFGTTKTQATYTVTLGYDQAIFDITQDVSLSVPNIVTTRSELDKPNDLFALPANGKVGQ